MRAYSVIIGLNALTRRESDQLALAQRALSRSDRSLISLRRRWRPPSTLPLSRFLLSQICRLSFSRVPLTSLPPLTPPFLWRLAVGAPRRARALARKAPGP